MKNIFKKNHIIITALAIMIVIAGYLSFTNNDTPKDKATTANPDIEDFVELDDDMDLVTNTNGDATKNDETKADDTTKDDTDITDTDTTDKDNNAENGTDENTTPVDTQNDADELGQNDISDEDILETAQDVTDNGELDLKDGTPGEAVLANAKIDSSYFISSKLEREQVRAKSREYLMEIIDSSKVSEEQKQDAINSMIELTGIIEKERVAEMLLEAKGFEGSVVFINDGEVDVVVNAQNLTDQQLAIIEDVVKTKTEIEVKNIHITPVVVTE